MFFSEKSHLPYKSLGETAYAESYGRNHLQEGLISLLIQTKKQPIKLVFRSFEESKYNNLIL